MRLVVETDPGVVELNWVWLPTWMGQNTVFKRQVEEHVQAWLAQQPQPVKIDTKLLNDLDDLIAAYIHKTFPEPKGLMKFLEGLAYVEDGTER